MSTFPALIESFMQSLSQYLPISKLAVRDILEYCLHWPEANAEILTLVSLIGSIALLVFFRYDWLGLLSATLTSIVKPFSLKPEARSLDQHSLLFMLIVLVPSFLAEFFAPELARDNEMLYHPFVSAALTLFVAFGFYFSSQFNKRLHGLNHLKLVDACIVGAASLLSVHFAIPVVAIWWIFLAGRNYHYETIFKYSMLLLGVLLFQSTVVHWEQTGLRNAIETIGVLNSVAIVFVSFVSFWMGLEHLSKSVNDATFRFFQWLNVGFGVFLFATHFLKI